VLGRGAIADPLLFARLPGSSAEPSRQEVAAMLRRYLRSAGAYGELSAARPVLGKVKEILAFVADPVFAKCLKQLKKAQSVRTFAALVDELE
jgi:hypothetical protein